ncbi:MAG: peptidylprolyl isomerase [Clostridium sp.]|nr:peptidylprolyl isomerase [Clostridium sp.]
MEPIVTIKMANGDVMKAKLSSKEAPNTVRNFISLINKKFYDGLTFHRVIPGFVIQGGCPSGDGTGGPGYSIKGEFPSNGFKNEMKHTKGVLSMARAMALDSAGSQFFIMAGDAPHLDGQYAAFGKLTEGFDVLDKIIAVPTDYNDRPLEDVVIETITVDTFDTEYDEPETI